MDAQEKARKADELRKKKEAAKKPPVAAKKPEEKPQDAAPPEPKSVIKIFRGKAAETEELTAQ